MKNTTNHYLQAIEDAADMAENFINEIVSQLQAEGEASTDFLNDYVNGDEFHHMHHVDKAYSLTEAAELLEELNDYFETDSGLWYGLEPREAISAQAAYTYGNCVASQWTDLINNINHDAQSGILADMLGEDDPAENDVIRERVREIIEEFQD